MLARNPIGTRPGSGRMWLGALAAAIVLGLPAVAGAAPRRPPSVVPPGLNETVVTAHIVVHYTTAAGDPNASTAEHARLLAEAGDQAYATEVEQWGFPPPADDGDGKTDIYVFAGTQGLATRDTSGEQTTGFITYTPNGHQVHISHEYFHLIQFAIYAREAGWLVESTADWASVGVFGGVSKAPFAFVRPEVSMDCTGANPTDCAGDRYGYHGNTYMQLLSERYGGPGVIREIFERAALLGAGNRQSHPVQALSDTLAAHGTSIEATFNVYALANQTGAYALPGLGALRPRQTRSVVAESGRAPLMEIPVDHLAAKYVGFEPPGSPCSAATLRLTIVVPPGIPATPAFVKSDRTVTLLPPGVTTDIPWSTCADPGALVLPNPSTTTNATFGVQMSVSTPPAPVPRVKLMLAKRVALGRAFHFKVRSSGRGEFRALLRSRAVTLTGFLRSGTNRLTIRLPRGFKPGPHRLTVTPYSSSGRKGKPVSRTISFTRG